MRSRHAPIDLFGLRIAIGIRRSDASDPRRLEARLRSGTARLVAVVVFSGLVFACLKNPSILLASAVFTVVTGVLLAGILGVAYHEPPRRYFWLGFTIFGLGHQFAAFWLPWSPDRQPVLLTSYLYEFGREILVFGQASFESLVWRLTRTSLDNVPAWQIANSVASLLVAWVAGFVTRSVFVRRDERRSRPPGLR
jgi:hypothetical protein